MGREPALVVVKTEQAGGVSHEQAAHQAQVRPGGPGPAERLGRPVGAGRRAPKSISLEAYHRDVLRSWHALDLNGDGYITRQELRALPRQAQGMLGSLRRADTDGDGRLSFKEVVAARMAAFEAADTDGNDELSPAEIEAYEARLSAERAAERPAKKGAKAEKAEKAVARP